MQRRDLLAAGLAAGAAAALPRVAAAQPARNRVLRFVPQANLTSLDPIWTTAYITRNHGLMIFDTLYGTGRDFQPQPQMAEGHVFEQDDKVCTITLRQGLRFHDNEPVRAIDCVASLTRWMRRSPMGQKLATVVEDLSAVDDRRLRFRLKQPFPLLIHAIGSVNAPIPFIMPERLARTDPFQQVREAVGSGPYRFKADEFNSGSMVVYERNAAYSPTPASARSLTAGPKVANFERVEWHIITDAATAASALQTGEVDWYEQPTPEFRQLFARTRDIKMEPIDPLPNAAIMRFNHLHPPFNDKKIRQAILAAVSQEDYLTAIVGTDPGMFQAVTGVFTPGTPLASDVGLEPLKGPRDIDRAKALLREAGYTNQPMRLIGPTDILAPSALSQVGADMFRRLGMNMDLVLTDWGTVVQRRASREPLERGGWSVFYTAFGSYDFLDPSGHFPIRGNGANAWFGWPTVPRLEQLRDAWFDAPDAATQKRLAEDIQRVVMDEVPYVPLGSYVSMTAMRRDLVDRVVGPAIFWGIRRA